MFSCRSRASPGISGEISLIACASGSLTAAISASSSAMGRPPPWARMVRPRSPFLDDVALGLGVHVPPGRILGAEDGVGVGLAQWPDLVPPARQLLPADRRQPAHPAGSSGRRYPFHA